MRKGPIPRGSLVDIILWHFWGLGLLAQLKKCLTTSRNTNRKIDSECFSQVIRLLRR